MSHRFLIVDDEPMVAMLLEDYLEILGYEDCVTATNLDMAREFAQQGDIDAAIMDINIGRETIWPIADLLKEKDIPFALASGAGKHDVKADYKDVPLLPKPYSQVTVKNIIDELLAG